MTYDRETLISVLTNRIAYTLRSESAVRISVLDADVIEARRVAEALLNQELADRNVIHSLLVLLSTEELLAAARESLEELLANIVKS